jgi:uncharacterized membrane protein YuzA (DUF378 family)
MNQMIKKIKALSTKLTAIGAYAYVNIDIGGSSNGSAGTVSSGTHNADSLFATLWHIGNLIMYALIGLAVIYIIWHAVKMIMTEGGDARKEHQVSIVWGIVGLAIILSIWGLVAILSQTFGLGNANGGKFESQQDFQSLMLTK